MGIYRGWGQLHDNLSIAIIITVKINVINNNYFCSHQRQIQVI